MSQDPEGSFHLQRSVAEPVSILMPVYNEVEGIESVVAELVEVVFRHLPEGSEFLIEEGGSTDGTRVVLEELNSRWPFLRIEYRDRPEGFAKAATTLYTRSSCPLVFFTDSDGQCVASEFWKLAPHIRHADFVLGSKRVRYDPLARRITSRTFNWIARLLFGFQFQDINFGFRLCKRSAVMDCLAVARHMPTLLNAEITLVAHSRGYRIREVTVHHRPRLFGVSRGLAPTSFLREARLALRGLVKIRLETKQRAQPPIANMYPIGEAAAFLYGTSPNWYLRTWHRFLARMIQEAAQGATESCAAILDAGCGTGELLRQLLQAGFKAVGCDISHEALMHAKNGALSRLLRADVCRLPFPDRTFDIVVCSEVLEHVNDDIAALKELLRVSRSEVIITVPAHRYLWTDSDETLAHIRRYTRSEVLTLADRASARVIRVNPYGCMPGLLVLMYKAYSWLTGLSKLTRIRRGAAPLATRHNVPPVIDSLASYAFTAELWLSRHSLIPWGHGWWACLGKCEERLLEQDTAVALEAGGAGKLI